MLRPGLAIRAARRAQAGFILEGSALRPEYLADWQADDLLALCFHAESETLGARIRHESAYATRSDDTKRAIDKFTERSVRENTVLVASAEECGVRLIDTTDFSNTERLIDELRSALTR
jgi:2-phosphoglycerate kinase